MTDDTNRFMKPVGPPNILVSADGQLRKVGDPVKTAPRWVPILGAVVLPAVMFLVVLLITMAPSWVFDWIFAGGVLLIVMVFGACIATGIWHTFTYSGNCESD